MLVENAIAVELKAAKTLDSVHMAQCTHYFPASCLRLSPLFNSAKPRTEIHRMANGGCAGTVHQRASAIPISFCLFEPAPLLMVWRGASREAQAESEQWHVDRRSLNVLAGHEFCSTGICRGRGSVTGRIWSKTTASPSGAAPRGFMQRWIATIAGARHGRAIQHRDAEGRRGRRDSIPGYGTTLIASSMIRPVRSTPLPCPHVATASPAFTAIPVLNPRHGPHPLARRANNMVCNDWYKAATACPTARATIGTLCRSRLRQAQ
jgi:hypothetical protein